MDLLRLRLRRTAPTGEGSPVGHEVRCGRFEEGAPPADNLRLPAAACRMPAHSFIQCFSSILQQSWISPFVDRTGAGMSGATGAGRRRTNAFEDNQKVLLYA